MKYILMDSIISHFYLLNFITNQYQTILCYQSIVFIVDTKTGNNHKRLQTTTNHHQRLQTTRKRPQTTTK